MLCRLGRKADALKELELSLALDIEDINAHLQRNEAASMHRRIQRELNGRWFP